MESFSVFHHRGLRKNYLDAVGWTQDDFRDFLDRLRSESYRPESLLLDLFVNGFSAVEHPTLGHRSILWWRERAPNLPRRFWNLAALGYARAMADSGQNDVLFVDFREEELATDPGLVEALRASARGQLRLGWVCWSHTLLEHWQRDGMGEVDEREQRLRALLNNLGWEPCSVPVTDPLGAALAARALAQDTDSGPRRLLMFPAFGNDRLVHANWLGKTISRFEAAQGEGGEA